MVNRQIGVKISIIMIFYTIKYVLVKKKSMYFWFEIPFFFWGISLY